LAAPSQLEGEQAGMMVRDNSHVKSETEALHQAVAVHQAGNLAEAERIYRNVLITDSNNFDALHLIGVIQIQQGDYAEAVRQLDLALKANPNVASACYHRGVALNALKRFDEALASCNAAVALQPNYAEAHNIRGNVLNALARFDEALACYDAAIACNSQYAEAHNNRGNILQLSKRFVEALESYDRAIALNPDYAEAYSNRGGVFLEMRQIGEALASYTKAIQLKPDYAEAYGNIGNVLSEMKQFNEALTSYDLAIALKPNYVEAHLNRGHVLKDLKRLEEAFASYDKAFTLKSDIDYLEGLRLHIKMHLCDWRHYEEDCAHLMSTVANGLRVSPPFALLAIASTPELQLQCASRYVADKYPAAAVQVSKNARVSRDRVRVAYLSSDFHAHASAYLLAGLFESHDRSRFETFAVSFGPDKRDDMRQRLMQSFDQFVDVRYQSDQDISELLRSLEIDIAVDLKGFTQDARTGIFANRPAPLQVNYLGYPGTMGASYIDYVIADRFVIPPDRHASFSEKVVYLPDSYQINDRNRRILEPALSRAEAGLPEKGFVFCCFSDNYKITPDIFEIWMRLLRAVEGSVLWLLEGNPRAPINLRHEAQKRGISADRLVFAPRVSIDDHLARHYFADLFLDTYYCNAHTTASDALRAGLPLLTCAGKTFASRVAGSLLNAIGLPELITQSLEDYEVLALKLAREPELLASCKQKLARNRETSPLFDTKRFTRHIESAYATMWERHLRGEPPRSFSVASV
jgi:predicted O-linked N-acetylglucosamine transferase (SPINDLY family)